VHCFRLLVYSDIDILQGIVARRVRYITTSLMATSLQISTFDDKAAGKRMLIIGQ